MDIEYYNCTLQEILNTCNTITEMQQMYSNCVNMNTLNAYAYEPSISELDSLLYNDELGKMGKFTIFNNEIFLKCSELACISGLEFKNYLVKLSKKVILPDTTFLMSLDDNLGSYGNIKHFDAKLQERVTNFPIFSWSKNNDSKNVERNFLLLPDRYMILENRWDILKEEIINFSNEISWEEKIEKTYWRGSQNGKPGNDIINHNGRVEAVLMSLNNSHLIDAKFIFYEDKFGVRNDDYYRNTYKGEQLKEIIQKTLTTYESKKESLKYKYLLSIDGHTACWERVAWILLSNSLLLKQESDEIEWYDKLLHPFENFIPVKADLSDLSQKIIWAKDNDLNVKQFVRNANKLAGFLFSRDAIDNFTYHSLDIYSKKFPQMRVNVTFLSKIKYSTYHSTYYFIENYHITIYLSLLIINLLFIYIIKVYVPRNGKRI